MQNNIASAPTTHVLEQAATEQLNARRGAERALVEAQNRISQLDHALQQAGQVGRQREGMAQLEFCNESSRRSHRSGFVDGHDDCGMQYGCYEQRCDDGRETRSVQLYFVLIMLCTERALDCIANAPDGWGMEAWRMLFQAYSPKNNARLVVMMLESAGVSFGHKRCGEQSGDDGTEDQRVREIREHRNSGIPEDWHRDLSSRRRTDENASHYALAHVGNIPGHQNGSDKREVSPECSEGEIGRRNGRGCFHERIQRCFPRIWQKQDSEVVCWYCEKKGHRASDCRKKQRDNDSGKSKGSKKGDSKGKSNKEKTKGKCHKCGKTGRMSKDCRSKETSAFEAGDELAQSGCIEWQAKI